MLVVDASALVDLLLGNDRGRRVRAVLGPAHVIAPELIDVEVVSALARLVRAEVLDMTTATACVALLKRMPLTRMPHRPLLDGAWRLRDRLRVSDAFYVACSELVDAPLLSTDARLGRAPLPGRVITVVR